MRAAVALTALAGSVVLTACGSSATLSPVAQAAEKTIAKGSEHVSITGTVGVAQTRLRIAGEGDFQTDPKLGKVTFHMTGAGFSDVTIKEVMKEHIVYMDSPLFQHALPAGKDWIALDLRQAGKRAGVDFSQFRQTSPTDTLLALRKAGKVTKLGKQTIDGVETTHYRATIDFRKVPNGGQIEKLAHITTVPVDVWVDRDDLLRRMLLSYTATVSGQSATTTLNMNLSNYGEPVHVQLPPAAKTIDMTKLGG